MSKLPTLAVYGPAEHDRSGVGRYITSSLKELQRDFTCTRVSDGAFVHPNRFDFVLYHLGNNKFHHCAFEALRMRSGPAIFHEFNNHQYYNWAFNGLPKKEQAYLTRYLPVQAPKRKEDSAAGSSAAGGGLPTKEDLLTARSEKIALEHASCALVHSHAAALHLDSVPSSPLVARIPFPVERLRDDPSRKILSSLAIEPDSFVFGVFGFIAANKSVSKILEAWKTWDQRPQKARLLIVGERLDDLDVPTDAAVTETGYVDSDVFDALIMAVDAGIQLRERWGGETSGPLSALVAHGCPVIASDIPAAREVVKLAVADAILVDPAAATSCQKAMISMIETSQRVRVFRTSFAWTSWYAVIRPLIGEHGAPRT